MARRRRRVGNLLQRILESTVASNLYELTPRLNLGIVKVEKGWRGGRDPFARFWSRMAPLPVHTTREFRFILIKRRSLDQDE